MVICYQILSSDVADHLPEYATLKAIGYPNRYLSLVVLQESLILAAAGFVPGMPVTLGIYALLTEITGLPMLLDARPRRADSRADGRHVRRVRAAGRAQGEEGGPGRCLLTPPPDPSGGGCTPAPAGRGGGFPAARSPVLRIAG